LRGQRQPCTRSFDSSEVLRVDLVICGQRHDVVAAGALESRHDGRRLAEAAVQNDHRDVARPAVDEGFNITHDVPVGTVHHEYELVRQAHGVQARAILLVQLAHILVAPADRNDD
jgi:hypothetical protein